MVQIDSRVISSLIVLAALFKVGESITVADVYARLLEKERNIDDTFAFQFVRPIGSVAGELIWPRSYSTSAELMFDENGAAFPLRPRPSLSQILRRNSVDKIYNNPNADYYNYLRSRK